MKRIALIVPSIGGGGAEKVAADLSLYFEEKGYTVIFFVRDIPTSASYRYAGKVVQIPVTYAKKRCSFKLLQKEANHLRKMKEDYQIDVSVSFMQSCNLLNILSRNRDKVVVTLHCVVSERKECFNSITTNKWVFRYIYQLADEIVFVSQYCRKDWLCHYGDIFHKTRVIYNPIGPIRKKEKTEAVKYGENVIISVARMDRVKRPWYIVRMFSKVVKVYPDSRLLMLGGGEILPLMQKLAKEMGIEHNIHFLGNVENVDDYLDIAKVFVLASASESFGCSVVEAMRRGVPIVANDCPGGIKEIIENKCGIITPYMEDKKYSAADALSMEEIAMADAVIRILSNNSLYNKLSKAGKEKAEQFDLSHIGTIWEKEIVDGKMKNIQRKKMTASALCAICGLYAGMTAFVQKNKKNKKHVSEEQTDKFMSYFYILDKWMSLKEEGKSVEQYFVRRGYKRIAIYGMGKMGRHLIAELENASVEVAYGIDQKAEFLYTGVPIFNMEDEWQIVDAIIVTATFDYDNISKELRKKINCPIVSLKDVVFDNI